MNEIYASFNNPIELGTRAALILAAIEVEFTVDDLVMLDFSLLYSENFNGPENLHPAVPNYIAEISHRRDFLPDALRLFVNRGLLNLNVSEDGRTYKFNENTLAFVSCLQSRYYRKAWRRLSWMKENYLEVINTSLTDLSKRNL